MLLEAINEPSTQCEATVINISKDEKSFVVTPSNNPQFEVCISSLMPQNLKYTNEVINAILGDYQYCSGKTLVSEEAMKLIYEICDINRIFF